MTTARRPSTTISDATEHSTVAVLLDAERALNTAKRFKYPSWIGIDDSYGLASLIGMALNVYTVILLYPDYASESYGQEYYTSSVSAASPDEAVAQVRQNAVGDNTLNGESTIEDPTDFFVVGVIRGCSEFVKHNGE
jgi:hypothetical protein